MASEKSAFCLFFPLAYYVGEMHFHISLGYLQLLKGERKKNHRVPENEFVTKQKSLTS